MENGFISKLEKIVVANLDNDQFSVEELAREASLSRFQIHRKLRKITGQSVSRFIREIRLKKAMELLQKKEISASEVAYEVGFGSPTYFNKCFHQYYGITPGQVIKSESSESQNNRIPAQEKVTEYEKINYNNTVDNYIGFWEELKRRQVPAAALSYLLFSWLLLQIINISGNYIAMDPRFFITVLWVLIAGFFIAVFLAWHIEKTDKGFTKIGNNKRDNYPNSPVGKKSIPGTMSMAFLLIIILFTYLVPQRDNKSFEFPTYESIHGNRPGVKSIAVIPFKTYNMPEDYGHLAIGIMDEMINQLYKVNDLEVRPFTSTWQYRQSEKSIEQIIDEQEVDFVLYGDAMVINSNDLIRISVTVINAHKLVVWNDIFELSPGGNEWSDFTGIIAKNVMRELKIKLSAKENHLLEKKSTHEMEAVEYYMKGRDYYGAYLSKFQKRDLYDAETLYRKSLKVDSLYAQAYIGLAEVCKRKRVRWIDKSVDDKQYADSIGFYATKALEINDNLAEAYALMGEYFEYNGQIENAVENQMKAISVNPDLAEAYINMGRISNYVQQDPVEAYKYFRAALAIEKKGLFHSEILWEIFRILASLGDYEQAKEIEFRNAELHPGMVQYLNPIAFLNIQYGKFDKAKLFLDSICIDDSCTFFYGMVYTFSEQFELALPLLEQEKGPGIEPPTPMQKPPGDHLLAYNYLKTGRIDEGMKIYDSVIPYYEDKQDYWSLAEIYAEVGRHEEALDMLLKLEQQYPYHNRFELIKHLPTFIPLRNHPEFIALIDRVDKKKAAALRKIKAFDKNS